MVGTIAEQPPSSAADRPQTAREHRGNKPLGEEAARPGKLGMFSLA